MTVTLWFKGSIHHFKSKGCFKSVIPPASTVLVVKYKMSLDEMFSALFDALWKTRDERCATI